MFSVYLLLLKLHITGDVEAGATSIVTVRRRRCRRAEHLTAATTAGRAATAAATRQERHPAMLLMPAHRVVCRERRTRRHRC